MDTDQLSMAPAWRTTQTAYAAIDAMQGQPAPQRVAAVFLLFNELVTALGSDPSQAIDMARRMARHAEDHYSLELNALRAYIRNEVIAK